jgi:hypothetical protein
VVTIEIFVSRLVMVHSAPEITASVGSVTLPEIRALSVCPEATTEANKRIPTRAGLCVKISPAWSHDVVFPVSRQEGE